MLLTRLDLRELAPPEPMQRILASLETLPRGGQVMHAIGVAPGIEQGHQRQRAERCERDQPPAGDACIAICHGDDHAALDPPRVA